MKVICSVSDGETSIKIVASSELEQKIIQDLISGVISIDKSNVGKEGELVLSSKKLGT